MDRRTKDLAKNTLIIGIGSFFTKLLSFVMVPVFTRWLTQKEFGRYDLIITYVSLVLPILTLMVEQSVFRFAYENRINAKKYLFVSLLINIVVSVVFDFTVLLIMGWNVEIIGFLLYANTLAQFSCYQEYLRGINALTQYSIANVFVGVQTIIWIVWMLKVVEGGVAGALIAFGIAYLFTDFILLSKEKPYKEKIKIKECFDIAKKMIRYSLPLIPNNISWWITNASSRTVISVALGATENGIYAVSAKIPSMLTLAFSVFNLSWQQSAVDASLETGAIDYYKKMHVNVSRIVFSLGCALSLVTPVVYMCFFDKEYYAGIMYVPILINGAIFLCLSQYLSGVLVANKDTKNIGASTVIGAVANLLFTMSFVGEIGAYAPAIATLLAYILMYITRLKKLSFLVQKRVLVELILCESLYLLLTFFVTILFLQNNISLYLISMLFVLLLLGALNWYFLFQIRSE